MTGEGRRREIDGSEPPWYRTGDREDTDAGRLCQLPVNGPAADDANCVLNLDAMSSACRARWTETRHARDESVATEGDERFRVPDVAKVPFPSGSRWLVVAFGGSVVCVRDSAAVAVAQGLPYAERRGADRSGWPLAARRRSGARFCAR
jgi:hypothetical protein